MPSCSQALEVLASLNSIDQERNRLIDIAVDGSITEDEYDDFVIIRDKLDRVSRTVESLKLWIQNTIASGELDKNVMERKSDM